ncbi:hypothetical protein ACTU3I_06280 [Microbacterium sp. RD1]|uniref:hypothetical protein n=1 Tax=Microbacterium sp. RD1 TaxID=3457313 RepID=UPI003FA57E13
MRFETTLHQTGNNTGIEVPPDVLEALGGGKRPAAKASETRERRIAAIVAKLAG